MPEQRLALDLAGIRARLERHGVGVTDARVMLIVALTPELTVSRSGRLLVKTNDPSAAQGVVRRFFALAGLSVQGELGSSPPTG